MSENRSEADVESVRGGRNNGMKSKKEKRGRIEEQPGKETRRLHAEKPACPRRGNPTAVKAVLSGCQTERDGKALWNPEESDCDLTSCWTTCIASEALCR
jgi:hypothetical protein